MFCASKTPSSSMEMRKTPFFTFSFAGLLSESLSSFFSAFLSASFFAAFFFATGPLAASFFAAPFLSASFLAGGAAGAEAPIAKVPLRTVVLPEYSPAAGGGGVFGSSAVAMPKPVAEKIAKATSQQAEQRAENNIGGFLWVSANYV